MLTGARQRRASACTRTKQTVSAIIDSGNNYLIVVKRNQKTLHRQIERRKCVGFPRLFHSAVEFQATSTKAISCFEQIEKTRNRLTHRTVEVLAPPSNIDSQWVGVHSIIKIFRSRTRGNHDYESDSATYYISSLPNSFGVK